MWNQDLYIKTLNYAATAHGDQKVPGRPYSYVVHITEVAQEVMAAAANAHMEGNPFDGDLAMQCALLHDTIEDAGKRYDDIKMAFGEAVAAGVLALSKNPALPKEQQMADSLQRIMGQPKAVWRVKLSDRIVNLQPPPAYWTREKKTAYRNEAMEILKTLGEADAFLAQRLQNKIEAYSLD